MHFVVANHYKHAVGSRTEAVLVNNIPACVQFGDEAEVVEAVVGAAAEGKLALEDILSLLSHLNARIRLPALICTNLIQVLVNNYGGVNRIRLTEFGDGQNASHVRSSRIDDEAAAVAVVRITNESRSFNPVLVKHLRVDVAASAVVAVFQRPSAVGLLFTCLPDPRIDVVQIPRVSDLVCKRLNIL